MKKIVGIIIAVAFATQGWGQQLTDENRRLIHPVDLEEADTPGLRRSIEQGANFTIVGENSSGDKYKIYFWNWNKKTEPSKYYQRNYDTTRDRQRYFLIEKSLVDVHSMKIFSRFDPVYGVLVLPFKWRLDSKAVEPTFSLNIAGGVKWRPWQTNRHVVSFLVGIGPSTVALNPHNSGLTPNANSITTAAITLSGNLMYQFKVVQFGFSFGMDKIFDNHIYDWESQGNAWFAMGVGLNLFTDDASAPSAKEN